MATAWRVRGYELDRLLGTGSSSEVWRAHATASGDAVALKRMPIGDAEHARRAVAEAAKLQVLDHPHLVRVHDLVLQRDAAVLVLDLADAGSLADLLTVRGRVTPGEAVTALAPVAAALAHVHAAGIVHGDVSPANILFARGGVALLADLGVARLYGDDAAVESTPAYIDPVVARGGVPSAYSDVFMLGAVALHALTGAAVWTANEGDAALVQACGGGLEHVERRLAVADLPPGVAAVITRALSPQPRQRGTAADFALDLRHSATPVAVELAAGCTRVVERPASPGPASPGPASVGPASDPPSGEPPLAPTSRAVPLVRAPLPLTPVPLNLDPETSARALGTQVSAGSAARGGGARHAALPVARVTTRPERRAKRLAKRSPRAADSGPTPVERARRAIAGRGDAARFVSAAEPVAGDAVADHVATTVADRGSPAAPVTCDPARPQFTRPTGGSIPDNDVVVGRPAPTRAVARPRPALPPARRGKARIWATGVGVLAIVVAVIIASLLLGRARENAVAAPPAPPAHPRPASLTATPPTRATPPVSTSHAAASASSTSSTAAHDWPAVLRSIDELRARAFATRDVGLLAQVYVNGPLRSADTALLERLVPSGCVLKGVRTSFRDVALHHVDGVSTVITARVSLPPSQLLCPGRAARSIAAVAPTVLSFTLVQRHGTVLIADESRPT